MSTRRPTMLQRFSPVLPSLVSCCWLLESDDTDAAFFVINVLYDEGSGRSAPPQSPRGTQAALSARRTAPRYCPSTLTSRIQSLLMSQMNMPVCPSVVIPQGPMSFFMFSNLPENGMVCMRHGNQKVQSQ